MSKLKENVGNLEEEIMYPLPDGENLTLGDERFLACENAFEPSIIGSNSTGLHKMMNNTINKGNIDLRRSLYSNIYLSGGLTNTENFAQRFKEEL